MSTKYHYRPLVDGFSQNFNLQEEQKMIRRFEKDILAEIKKRKDQKLPVSQYIVNFSLKEKRCFFGLLKRFERVKVYYRLEEGMSRQYLIAA
ncbi:hypothetical protein VBH21_13935 [Enterococcus hirae]|uniref:hypothetical protein n=1 Tax=Enterococcus TaxID=1350 RepID=UPI0009BFA714|nr:hypothetical protein [Enterococcus hirae]EMF0042685.1 hypothetical protein [Enterococcus hirae]EMF0103048.1 hypothetical protein [Enterococcus hirae]EMF0105756.1 hypothetical protein [Enterococcus hirae]EMF0623268.1 hypothetical protein [Enterococcus hirae]OQO55061.1 hypothetical protein BHG15_14810 [Enterococcus hirae]